MVFNSTNDDTRVTTWHFIYPKIRNNDAYTVHSSLKPHPL